jgi:hypothetical protein
VLISDAACGAGRKACPNLALIGIYGGFLRLARDAPQTKNGNWFLEKIVLKQRDEIVIRFHLTRS